MRQVFTAAIFLLSIATNVCVAQQYTIPFKAVYSANLTELPGHIWVDFGKEAFGFSLRGVASETGREADVSYTFNTDRSRFRRALEEVSAFRGEKYLLGVRDCRTLAEAVAIAIGLKTPEYSKDTPPAKWLADLVDLN